MSAASTETSRPRGCARPGCAAAAAATLRFAYTTREARIDPLEEDPPAQSYDLCAAHAARTRPPAGWSLRDTRGSVPDGDAVDGPASRRAADRERTPPVRGLESLGGEETIARLTAALRAAAQPDPVRPEGVDEAV